MGGTEMRLEVADHHRAVRAALDETVVQEHLDDLLDVQRIAVGGRGDPFPRDRREGRPLQERLDEVLGVRRCERLEQEGRGVRLPTAPADPKVEELGSRHRQQEQRDAMDPVRQVLDEVEDRRLSPLQVVEHDDRRAGWSPDARGGGGSPRRAPRRALAPMAIPSGSASWERIASASSIPASRSRSRSITVDGVGILVESGRRAEEFRDRVPGDPLAIWQASATQDGRVRARVQRGTHGRAGSCRHRPTRAP